MNSNVVLCFISNDQPIAISKHHDLQLARSCIDQVFKPMCVPGGKFCVGAVLEECSDKRCVVIMAVCRMAAILAASTATVMMADALDNGAPCTSSSLLTSCVGTCRLWLESLCTRLSRHH